jgi:hypothetical protein
MNTGTLIVEDFDFNRYPISRTYPLGDKTVIQISETSAGSTKNSLLDQIEYLEDEIRNYEQIKSDLEDSNDELESANEELEFQLNDVFKILENDFGFTPDFGCSAATNLYNLKSFLEGY